MTERIEQHADQHSCANGYGIEDGTGVAHSHWWTFDRDGLQSFVAAIRREALEEAAKVCVAYSNDLDSGKKNSKVVSAAMCGALSCASEIRALAGSTEGR